MECIAGLFLLVAVAGLIAILVVLIVKALTDSDKDHKTGHDKYSDGYD